MRDTRLQQLRGVVAVMLPLAVLLVAGLLAVAQWPAYWTWIAPERAPMSFVEVALLLLAAFDGALLCLLAPLRPTAVQRVGVWATLSVGALVLTLDERFYLHQRLRDFHLAPRGGGLPWGAPGDYVLVVYAFAGLALLPLVLRAMKGDRLARRLFGSGVLLAVIAVTADSFDVERMSLAGLRLQQTLEEVTEGLAGALVAAGLSVHAIDRLASLIPSSGSPAD